MRMGEVPVDVALAPLEVRPAWTKMVCIVVDVLRASSTLAVLLEKGCPEVFTAGTVAGARSLARGGGLLLGGERNGLTLKGFDFGNSPFELQDLDVRGRAAVLTTTNGTKVIEKVASAPAVLIGCFLNARACCGGAIELARRYGTGIGIVCAGEKGMFVLDDAFCAGYLVEALLLAGAERGVAVTLSDAALAARKLFAAYPDILSCFRESSSGRLLVEIGRAEDLLSCSRVDASGVVPILAGSAPCRFVPLS